MFDFTFEPFLSLLIVLLISYVAAIILIGLNDGICYLCKVVKVIARKVQK
jgi:hypothetical protein